MVSFGDVTVSLIFLFLQEMANTTAVIASLAILWLVLNCASAGGDLGAREFRSTSQWLRKSDQSFYRQQKHANQKVECIQTSSRLDFVIYLFCVCIVDFESIGCIDALTERTKEFGRSNT